MRVGDAASSSRSSCVDSANLISGFSRGCLSAVVNVRPSSKRSVSLLSLAPRYGTNVTGAMPDFVDPSTLGSADGPMVPDGDNPAIPMVPCDTVCPMIPAPAIPVLAIAGDANP